MDQTTIGSVDVTSAIVQAYVSKNPISAGDVPGFIAQVHAAVTALYTGVTAPAEPAALVPAVPIKKSITPDYIICLDDGVKLKSLRRHIGKLGYTPESYKAKWGLPADYPLVCPNYSAVRSALAKANGLGTKGASH